MVADTPSYPPLITGPTSPEFLVSLKQSAQTPLAEFAYIDESGDVGLGGGGTKTFTLGCVLVPLNAWDQRLKYLSGMRRDSRARYGIALNYEAKANHIVGAKKLYRELGMGDGQLRDYYRRHMRAAARISSGTFAIVIQKDLLRNRDTDVLKMTWEYLLERLRKRTETTGVPIILIHDMGQDDEIRKIVRRFRRITWTAKGERVDAPLIVEDPSPRDSQQSYFIQLADMVAYAASAKAVPRTGRTTKICNHEMWDELGDVRVEAVSTTRRDGIYVFPR